MSGKSARWALPRAMGERGYTLIEVVLVVAIFALLLATAAFTVGSKPFALRAAATQFDAAFAQAQALAASSGNGATLVFAPRSGAQGFTMSLFAGRPNGGAMAPGGAPSATFDAQISVRGVGSPPFAIFLSSAGRATAMGGYPPLPVVTPLPLVAREPPCPDSSDGAVLVTFTSGAATQTQRLACPASAVSP